MGLRVDNGGSCVSLKPMDPSMISDGRNRPKKIIYGMVDLEINTEGVGGTAFVTFYFPEPVPHSYKLYKYAPSIGWKNYNPHTQFNSARDQVTLTLVDGGSAMMMVLQMGGFWIHQVSGLIPRLRAQALRKIIQAASFRACRCPVSENSLS